LRAKMSLLFSSRRPFNSDLSSARQSNSASISSQIKIMFFA
jgi:hypothetical protein